MWTTLFEKLSVLLKALGIEEDGSVFIPKLKAWLKETGVTNLFYLALSSISIIKNEIPFEEFGLGFLIPYTGYLSAGFIAVMIYLNWNIISKLFKAKVKDIEKAEDIKNQFRAQ